MINSICVCGAGTMGSGIAQVSAQAGFHTLLFDMKPEILETARHNIVANLDLAVKKNKLTSEQATLTLQQIHFTRDIDECLADVFIEAIIENPDSKIALFNRLAELNHSECVFASNTSSLSITSLAGKIQNPERVIGMHFFNPAPLMKLVEIVKTKYSSQTILETVIDLTKQLGKTPVICTDAPGFIVNRVARPYYIESLRLAEEGLADFKTIDTLMEASGFRMGPFKLMDLIGNDVNYAVSKSVYDQLNQPERLRPSYIQEEKVKNGELGKKTKKGYYDYE